MISLITLDGSYPQICRVEVELRKRDPVYNDLSDSEAYSTIIY